jgi:hypothetical protein
MILKRTKSIYVLGIYGRKSVVTGTGRVLDLIRMSMRGLAKGEQERITIKYLCEEEKTDI